MNSVAPSGAETHDFVRLRLVCHALGAASTADVASEAWDLVDPVEVAQRASCDLFTVTYVTHPDPERYFLPTFTVVLGPQSYPKSIDAAMQMLKARVEDACDALADEAIVR